MLKKLRVKFVAIVMASVAIVLATVFTGICITEYQRSMNDIDNALTNAINRASEGMRNLQGADMHQGPFGPAGNYGAPLPDDFANMQPPVQTDGDMAADAQGTAAADDAQGTAAAGDASAEQDTAAADDGAQGAGDSAAQGAGDAAVQGAGDAAAQGSPEANSQTAQDVTGNRSSNKQLMGPRIGGRDGAERSLVPVAVYQVTESTELSLVSGFATAEIDDGVLSSASSRVAQTEEGMGTFDDLGLHYQKRTVESATYIAFADTSSTQGWQSLALTLGIAGIVVLAVFFVISLLLSKWALRPVSEAWEQQRQFVADASHDLKTPLTVVLANTSILLKHPADSIASQSQWIESTQVEAEHMQGLVNEMLELAQVESRADVHHEPLDFSDLVDGQALQFESVAFERGCMLESRIAEGISVNGDAARLNKMTSTLLENALKYVDDGGTVDVALEPERSGKQVRLAIRNTGSIIAPDDLPHIFDRFYRTDKARTSGAGGFGLGLAIAREIAREHGGDITCTSSEPAGTTFTVTLPMA